MKDLTYSIDLNTQSEILGLALQEDYEVYVIEGSLLDNILIINEHITFGRAKPRKYIIINEKYLNEYSSELIMTLTDDEEKVKAFIDDYNEIEEQSEEGYLPF